MFWSIWCVLVFLSVICRLLDSLKEKNAFGIYSEARWTEQWTEWEVLIAQSHRSTDPVHVDRPIYGSTGSTRTNELFTPFYPLHSRIDRGTRPLGLRKDQGRPRRRFTSSWERFESFVLVLCDLLRFVKEFISKPFGEDLLNLYSVLIQSYHVFFIKIVLFLLSYVWVVI